VEADAAKADAIVIHTCSSSKRPKRIYPNHFGRRKLKGEKEKTFRDGLHGPAAWKRNDG